VSSVTFQGPRWAWARLAGLPLPSAGRRPERAARGRRSPAASSSVRCVSEKALCVRTLLRKAVALSRGPLDGVERTCGPAEPTRLLEPWMALSRMRADRREERRCLVGGPHSR
jgi:hypothetical protein